MAQPPAGSSLLFGALADSGRIKERKNGSYRMVLQGVDEIDWFTDRPDRVEGTWKPQKLLRRWDKFFGSSEPNAQATFEMGSKKKLVTFEMFKPNMKSGKMIFDIKSIGDSGKDKLTGLQDKKMSDVSIFIDNSSSSVPPCNLSGAMMESFATQNNKVNLNGADLSGVDLSNSEYGWNSDLSNAKMNGANLKGACLCGVMLSWGDLELNGANLTNVDFTGVDLSKAELSGATWFKTTCPDGNPNTGTSPCTEDSIINRIKNPDCDC